MGSVQQGELWCLFSVTTRQQEAYSSTLFSHNMQLSIEFVVIHTLHHSVLICIPVCREVLFGQVLYSHLNFHPPLLLQLYSMYFTCSGSCSRCHPWRSYTAVCHSSTAFGVRTHTVETNIKKNPGPCYWPVLHTTAKKILYMERYIVWRQLSIVFMFNSSLMLSHLPATAVSQTLHDGINLCFKHFCQFGAVLIHTGRFTVVKPSVVEHEPHIIHILPRLLVLTRIQLALDGG